MSQATPPIIIIIGGHAYHFGSMDEAQTFIASYAGKEHAPDVEYYA